MFTVQCSGEVHESIRRPSYLSVTKHTPNTLQPVEEHMFCSLEATDHMCDCCFMPQKTPLSNFINATNNERRRCVQNSAQEESPCVDTRVRPCTRAQPDKLMQTNANERQQNLEVVLEENTTVTEKMDLIEKSPVCCIATTPCAWCGWKSTCVTRTARRS